MQKSFHLDEADVVLVTGALIACQADLSLTVNRSDDEMELETAKADLAHVLRLLTVFKS